MVTVTGAVPVSTDAEAISPAPAADNQIAGFNTMPRCRPQDEDTCLAISNRPVCSGTTLNTKAGDMCAYPACWCE
jgi:hypothetical protein